MADLTKAELATLKKDAARYRFIKSRVKPITLMQTNYWPEQIPMRPVTAWSSYYAGGGIDGHTPISFDKAVDLDMKRHQPQHSQSK